MLLFQFIYLSICTYVNNTSINIFFLVYRTVDDFRAYLTLTVPAPTSPTRIQVVDSARRVSTVWEATSPHLKVSPHKHLHRDMQHNSNRYHRSNHLQYLQNQPRNICRWTHVLECCLSHVGRLLY